MGYYNHYRRPYFHRRHHRYRRSSNTEKKVLAIIGIVFLLAVSLISKGSASFLFIIFLALYVGILIFIVRKFLKWGGKQSEFSVINVNQQDTAQINSDKHGCKCYMEGLSDGEIEVANILSRELDYKDYFIFNNLIIPSENNGSTQIDHIVASRFGIFVIESKDYSGWIFGDKNQQFWTQSLPGGNNKFQFQNPIHQNYAHIMALKILMPFIGDNFYNIVVFSDKSEIKTTPIENVTRLSQLIGSIKKYAQEKLTENDLQLAIGKLSYACQTIDITNLDHIENLHTKFK